MGRELPNSENAPLLGGTESGGSYYFLNTENHQGGTTAAVRDNDGGLVHETLPEGSHADEFAPRVLGVVSLLFGWRKTKINTKLLFVFPFSDDR